MSFLEVKNLGFTYQSGSPSRNAALKDVCVSFPKGDIVGVIGHTGSGKSTLMQCLNGLIKPTTGKVFLNGTDIWENPKEIRKVRFKVGLVFQYPEYQLFEETVFKDIAYGPQNMGLGEEEIKERVIKSSQLVGLKEDLLSKSPFDLSGGEKRRVAIAGVLSMEPECLILDEPTAGLDPQGRQLIVELIRKYRERTGALVLVVSHNMEDMAAICDKLLVMNNGEVFNFGTVRDVFSDAEGIAEIGIDVPAVTEIAIKLKKLGVDVDTDIFTTEEMIKRLLALAVNSGKLPADSKGGADYE